MSATSASALRLGGLIQTSVGIAAGAGGPAGKPLGMGRVGRGEHGRARRDALLGQAVVHVGGRQQAEADVMVLGVVPGEEDVAVGSGVLDRAEALRERRAVLQRLELGLGERVVVRHVRPASASW